MLDEKLRELGKHKTSDICMSLKFCICKILSSLELDHVADTSLLPEGKFSEANFTPRLENNNVMDDVCVSHPFSSC